MLCKPSKEVEKEIERWIGNVIAEEKVGNKKKSDSARHNKSIKLRRH